MEAFDAQDQRHLSPAASRRAFPGKGIDAIDEADVSSWYARVADGSGLGAANRVLAVLSAMFNRAEEWGQRTDGTNPCRTVRRFTGRKLEGAVAQSGVWGIQQGNPG
jgi:hypothetical protein